MNERNRQTNARNSSKTAEKSERNSALFALRQQLLAGEALCGVQNAHRVADDSLYGIGHVAEAVGDLRLKPRVNLQSPAVCHGSQELGITGQRRENYEEECGEECEEECGED